MNSPELEASRKRPCSRRLGSVLLLRLRLRLRLRLLLLLLLLVGCGGGPEAVVTIPETRLVTTPAWRHATGSAGVGRRGLPTQQGGDGAGLEEAPFIYDLPAGWEARAPTELRMINLRLAGCPQAECTVAILGGSLEENLNHWRNQLALEPVDAVAIAALPQLSILGLPGVRLDLEGTSAGADGQPHEGTRLLGGLLDLGGAGLYVKMVGPAEVIAGETARFDAFCASLRARPRPASTRPTAPSTSSAEGHASDREASVATEPGKPLAASAFDPTALGWEAPADWSEVPGDDLGMRLVTFIPGGVDHTSCVITPLPGGAGGFLRNVNLWREQMSKEPLGEEAVAALPVVEVFGSPCPVVSITGTYVDKSGSAHGESSLLGVIVPVADHTLFIKLVGPVQSVAAERERFVAFLESLRYGR